MINEIYELTDQLITYCMLGIREITRGLLHGNLKVKSSGSTLQTGKKNCSDYQVRLFIVSTYITRSLTFFLLIIMSFKHPTMMMIMMMMMMIYKGADERWENYMQFTSSRMVPRFTEQG